MFWTFLVVLVALWLLGLLTSRTLGGLIHALPVVALVLLATRLASGAVQSSLADGDGSAAREADGRAGQDIVYVSGVTDTEEYRRAVGRAAWRARGVGQAAKGRVAALRSDGRWVDDARRGAPARPGLRTDSVNEGWGYAIASLGGPGAPPARLAPRSSPPAAERIARSAGGPRDVPGEALTGGIRR